jgi:hypothetical protein
MREIRTKRLGSTPKPRAGARGTWGRDRPTDRHTAQGSGRAEGAIAAPRAGRSLVTFRSSGTAEPQTGQLGPTRKELRL